MDKHYLLQEITEGLEAVKPLSVTLKTTKKKESLMKLLEEVEMELEHVVGCIVSLKGEME